MTIHHFAILEFINDGRARVLSIHSGEREASTRYIEQAERVKNGFLWTFYAGIRSSTLPRVGQVLSFDVSSQRDPLITCW